MPRASVPQNDFGQTVTAFCARRGITKKQLAEEAGVNYGNLLDAGKGRRAGHKTRDIVTRFINYRKGKGKRAG